MHWIRSFTFCISLIGLNLNSQLVHASSLYLPLNDTLMPWAERLAATGQLSSLKRPYRLADLHAVCQTTESHPNRSLNAFCQQLEKRYRQTQTSQVRASAQALSSNTVLPNQYSQHNESSLSLGTTAIWQSFDNLQGLVDIDLIQTADNTRFTPNNAYLALASDWLQLDIGYRGHWLSANRFNGTLYSNNAQNSPSITLSNPTPWTSAGIRFEAFLTQLEKHRNIRLDQSQSNGKPYLSGVQLSFQPTPEWGLSLNRTFMFGGGDRTVSATDFVEAFLNPTGKDNVGQSSCTGSSPNCEFGNQQMAIESQLKTQIGKQLALFNLGFAAEDTERGSSLHIGNVLMTLGVSLPYVTNSQALSMQYTEWEAGWYIHHIYPEGYTNNQVVMGSFWGSQQNNYVGSPGNELALQWEYFSSNTRYFKTDYRILTTTPVVDNQKQTLYAHILELSSKGLPLPSLGALLNASLFLGRNIDEEDWIGLNFELEF